LDDWPSDNNLTTSNKSYETLKWCLENDKNFKMILQKNFINNQFTLEAYRNSIAFKIEIFLIGKNCFQFVRGHNSFFLALRDIIWRPRQLWPFCHDFFSLIFSSKSIFLKSKQPNIINFDEKIVLATHMFDNLTQKKFFISKKQTNS